jgi:threonyl-tRNA synthetase
MPIITLPDGNNLTFPNKVTGFDVAEKISKSLAKQALVISVNGELKDLVF